MFCPMAHVSSSRDLATPEKIIDPSQCNEVIGFLNGHITDMALQEFDLEISQSGITKAYLVFVRNKGALIGLVAAFNDVNTDLPDFEPKSKNVMFLLE